MKESQIQTEFSKVCTIEGVFELKLARGKSLPYDALEEHQEESLLKVKNNGLFHKISDGNIFDNKRGFRLPSKKPFDCFYLKRFPAYVAICFYVPRKKRRLFLIDIEDFIEARINDTRKSITEEKAKKIASYEVNL